MITLPQGLNAFMKGQNLDGLKPFALLYRNKWDSVNNKYALDTTPIDISALIAKPNTLSMTLDVNEVAQYNANNVTLTLADTKNYFVEGTPNSYFPAGYQIYGSRIVLYYGTDGVNRTPLFTGVIKDLPTHKPENYQVDVKLVSPLEMLKDIEAKDFSDKVTGETLTYKSTDTDGHRIYWTTGTGVGGFDAVYANGTKLFEGVDYETDQLNALGLPAIVTIINSAYYSSTITADYYTWKTGLTVEQIVAGLVGLAGYDSGTEDIRNVVWNTAIRSSVIPTLDISLGYKKNGTNYIYSAETSFFNSSFTMSSPQQNFLAYAHLPQDFKVSFLANGTDNTSSYLSFVIGEMTGTHADGAGIINGILISFQRRANYNDFYVQQFVNGSSLGRTLIYSEHNNNDAPISIQVHENIAYVSSGGNTLTYTFSNGFSWGNGNAYNMSIGTVGAQYTTFYFKNFTLSKTDVNGVIETSLQKPGVALSYGDGNPYDFSVISGSFESDDTTYDLYYQTSEDGNSWSTIYPISFGANLGVTTKNLRAILEITSNYSNVNQFVFYYLASTLNLQLVNLSGLTVLEALQDFALISGYEFGVDRQGVFFFRPRVSSTTPTYILGHPEIVKVDTVKKNLSDFFTKLTLTFAQVPLEFYANTGERPTLVDKYGIINKEIDKPDIVNYDNPELAQAIGPQLLEVYSALPNIIQVTGKLNLALELGDIVSLRRNMNLITPEGYTDYSKYTDLNTYYRACKITGMNYNFSKRQITYTLRDVSNKNTEPQYEFNEYIYDLAVQYGVKE